MATYIYTTVKILSGNPSDLKKFCNIPTFSEELEQVIWKFSQRRVPALDYDQLVKDNPNYIFAIQHMSEADWEPKCYLRRAEQSLNITPENFTSIFYNKAVDLLKAAQGDLKQIVVPIDPLDLVEDEHD